MKNGCMLRSCHRKVGCMLRSSCILGSSCMRKSSCMLKSKMVYVEELLYGDEWINDCWNTFMRSSGCIGNSGCMSSSN